MGRSDRRAILERRAAFIASALSGLQLPSVAIAQPTGPKDEPKPLCSGREPTPADVERAKTLADEARAAMERSDFEAAEKSLEAAYGAFWSDGIVSLWVDAMLRAGHPEKALSVLGRHADCGGDLALVMRKSKEIETASGRVVVAVTGPGAKEANLRVDGVSVNRDQATRGLLVPPGAHTIAVVSPKGLTEQKRITIGENESMTVDLIAPQDDQGTAQVCLSMMRPTLPGRVRVAGGIVAPHIAVAPQEEGATVFGGGGLRLSIAAKLTDRIWFEGDGFGTLVANATDQLIYGGTSAGVLFYFDERFGWGLSFTAGRVFSLTNDPTPEREGAFPFFGFIPVPLSVWIGPVVIQARVPVFFAITGEGVTAPFPATVGPFISVSCGGVVVK